MKTTETEKIDFATLRRRAPSRFTEDLLNALSAGVDFSPYSIAIKSLELGDDPFIEKLNATFIVSGPTLRKRRFKGEPEGPKLFFTFTSEVSVAENLKELKEFVADHAHVAETSPTIHAKRTGQQGD
jgi:hypothetical protein